ncbi:putative glutathione S-transferase [Hyaloscypha hepaticicola]|uniref:glutathione transferase n=1 Tax=Hyaloscypha hepaticicola TaxID=2082293 RepID=A0A2J6PXD3_9HELO|nr:putative glutathione S-transferase [Hyaloscypha hepaticicola]
MVLKLHGVKGSTCTQRVLTALYEKEVPYELITIDFAKAEHKSEKYLKLQPFGKIPVLEDDGFNLFESRAIAKYIAKKYASQGTPLMPAEGDLKAYGLFEQACSLEEFYFDPAASAIAFEKIFKKWKGLGEPDEAELAKHAAALDKTLAVYEGILSKTKYLAGDELTLADLFHVPYGKMTRDAGYLSTFEKYPHVAKWFDGLLARESWKKVTL